MLQLADKVRSFIRENDIICPDDIIVIGLSGGADSVCLLDILGGLREEYNLTLYAVHVNHGIRGEQADCDEEFSVELCGRYGIEASVYRYDVPSMARERHMTEEEAARYARYEAFERECEKRKATKIATAHNKSDQAETILFRMSRGTGIRGMLGMQAVRDNIIRPLICVTGGEIRDYLSYRGMEYRLDATNDSTEYDRNRIRHNVIPELERINDNAVGHIADMASQLNSVYDWFRMTVDDAVKGCVRVTEHGMEADVERIRSLHPAIAGELIRDVIARISHSLKDVSAVHIEQTLKLIHMDSGKMVYLPYGIRAYRDYDVIRLTDDESPCMPIADAEYAVCISELSGNGADSVFYNVYLPDEGRLYPQIRITAHTAKYNGMCADIPKNICTKWFDYGKMGDTLYIRRVRFGDYMIINDGHKKMLTRYVIDKKIPRQYRDRLLVVADGSRIIWIAGGRSSEEYYLKDDSENVLVMNIEP